MDPSLRDLLFLGTGTFLFARNASKGLLGLTPRSLRVRLDAPRRELPPDRAETAAWLERHGFVRLGLYSERMLVSLHPMIEMDVFVHEAEGSYAFLGPPFVRLEMPYLYFLSGMGDGMLVFTSSYPRDAEELPGYSLVGVPGASPMKAWEEHRDRVKALAEEHGAAKAPPEAASALAVHRIWERRPGADERTRAVFAPQARMAGLGLLLVLVGALRPLTGLALGHVVAGLVALYALARSLPQALCHVRPALKRISVTEPRPPASAAAGAMRAQLETLGFRPLGTQVERLPMGGVESTMDVLVNEAEGAWANICSSPLGVDGYFLSRFDDGALALTWTVEQPVEKAPTFVVTGADGVEEAFRVHRSVLAELARSHGAPGASADPKAREEAARIYYRSVSPNRGWSPYAVPFRVTLASLALLAASVGVGIYF